MDKWTSTIAVITVSLLPVMGLSADTQERLVEPDYSGYTQCQNGQAGQYTCNGMDLMAQVNLGNKGIYANGGNDIWGWTDPLTNREYAIMGLTSKTTFVDITDASAPVHVADISTHTYDSSWRDIKVYKNYAYIVSEASRHGMQIVNLEKLRAYDGEIMTLSADKHYSHFGSAHNIVINEATGYAYAVGTSTCDAGMHMVDIREPLNPKFVGCIDRSIFEDVNDTSSKNNKMLHGEDYTHDAQCVVYSGPDTRYTGREICIASNADTVNIVDLTDKANPMQISVTDYNQLGYTHQGWFSEDQQFFFLGDELDEQQQGVKTTTIVWDVSDLENPKLHFRYEAQSNAIDHNMYVVGNLLYQANYTSGLRVLDISDVANKNITETAYFDMMPGNDRAQFDGVWSVYPYFASGNIVVSGINGHLYIVRKR